MDGAPVTGRCRLARIPAAAAELARNTLAPSAGGARLIASTLGLHAAALGGAVSLLDRVDTGTLPVRS